MGAKRRRHSDSFVIVFSSLLVFTIAIGETVVFQKALGQPEQQTVATNVSNIISNQTTDTANQTDMAINTKQNQTIANQTGTAALSANLTKGDFESLTQNLAEARKALESNDTNAVLDELNSASGELFQVISGQFDPAQVRQ